MPKKIASTLKYFLMPELKEIINNKDWQALKDALSVWPIPDIADLIKSLDEGILVFLLLPKDVQADVFGDFDWNTQQTFLSKLNSEQIKTLIAELSPDDRTELFEDLPGIMMQRLIQLLSPEDRKETLSLLGYPKNSVGRLMTSDYISVQPTWTVKKGLEYVREKGKIAETVDVVYVVDDKGHLLDDIPLRNLILAQPNQSISEIMDKQYIAIEPHRDQEEAAKLMERYDLIALPVIDSENILLGIVTIDDIIDVIRNEETEDFAKISAIHPKFVGREFITNLRKIPLSKIYRSRVTWLLALLFMDLITGGIIKKFESTIARYVILVTFLPVLVDTAGNAGSQSATLIIRALALGTVQIKDWLYLLGRELIIATLLGLTMGLGISVMGLFRGGMKVAPVVILTMVGNVIVGSCIGMLLPFIFVKFKKDPATASTPLITTIADIVGTAIYFGIATIFLM